LGDEYRGERQVQSGPVEVETIAGGHHESDDLARNTKRFQMRMVFRDVTAETLRWEWQRSEDNWATNQLMFGIDYTRAR